MMAKLAPWDDAPKKDASRFIGAERLLTLGSLSSGAVLTAAPKLKRTSLRKGAVKLAAFLVSCRKSLLNLKKLCFKNLLLYYACGKTFLQSSGDICKIL